MQMTLMSMAYFHLLKSNHYNMTSPLIKGFDAVKNLTTRVGGDMNRLYGQTDVRLPNAEILNEDCLVRGRSSVTR